MKDPERLNTSGTEEERRLLRAAQSVRVPESIKDEVRRAVEVRRAPRSRKRLLFGAAGLLVATTAVAALRPWWHALQNPQSPPAAPVSAPQPRPIILPLPATPDPRPAPAVPGSTPGPSQSQSPKLEAPPPLQTPDLDLDGFRRGLATPTLPPENRPAPPPRFIIDRSDRAAVVLEVSASGVRGQVRGLGVDLTVKGKQLTGRIGEDAVSINIFASREAHGQAGGRELGFLFTPTARGWIVDARLPDVGGRVRLEPELLYFRPGCDRELAAVANQPGLYQGVCSDDTRVRIWLAPGFLDPLARLVVLAMLLPEPEAMLRGQVRGLFPPP